jgi:branched-chain amino acid aminotransferase
MSDLIVWEVKRRCDEYELSELKFAHNTLDDVSLNLPQGVYTTFRTYRQQYFLRLDEHFERLDESARLMGFRIGINWSAFRSFLRIAIVNKQKKRKETPNSLYTRKREKPGVFNG